MCTYGPAVEALHHQLLHSQDMKPVSSQRRLPQLTAPQPTGQKKACASPASMDSTSTADMASMAPDLSMVEVGAILTGWSAAGKGGKATVDVSQSAKMHSSNVSCCL